MGYLAASAVAKISTGTTGARRALFLVLIAVLAFCAAAPSGTALADELASGNDAATVTLKTTPFPAPRILWGAQLAAAIVEEWNGDGTPFVGELYLAASPAYSDDHVLYAGAYGGGVFRTTDTGASWSSHNTGLVSANVQAVAISPAFAVDDTLFAATNGGGVFRSTNRASSWSAVNSGLLDLGVSSIALSPYFSVDHTLVAGTFGGGVFKSTDSGNSWSSVNSGLTDSNIRALSFSPNYTTDHTVFVGTFGGGAFRSTDDASTWRARSTGIADMDVQSLAVSPAFATDRTVFAGTYGGGVFKSTDSGDSWSAINSGLSLDVNAVAVSPSYTSDHTLFAGTLGGGVSRSTDFGTSWGGLNTGLTNNQVLSLAISPGYATDRTLFAGTDGGGVFVMDSAPPTTVAAASHPVDGDFDWYKTTPTVTLTSSEPGITQFQWDSSAGAWTTYLSAVTVPSGIHTLYYRSIDTVGNYEVASSRSFKVDAQAPFAPNTLTTAPSISTWSRDSTVFAHWATTPDAGSGIDGYSYSFTPGAADTPSPLKSAEESVTSTTSTALSSGTWYFHIRTRDSAGNWSGAKHYGPLFIDVGAPLVSGLRKVIVRKAARGKKVRVKVQGIDTYSTYLTITLRVKSKTGRAIPGSKVTVVRKAGIATITVRAPKKKGTYFYYVRAKDKAGNLSKLRKATMVVR